MEVTIDYTLDIRGEKIQPISHHKESNGICALYKYKERYIELYFFLNSGDAAYNGIIFRDEDHYNYKQLDGVNAICTNFNLTYPELVDEIEIALKMLDGPERNMLYGQDVSVNRFWIN